MPDGVEVALDWKEDDSMNAATPLVFCSHGLGRGICSHGLGGGCSHGLGARVDSGGASTALHGGNAM